MSHSRPFWFQRSFAPFKRVLPPPMANIIRGTVAAVFAPFFHYYRCGYFRSSLAQRAMDRRGRPLPWYTYPCIEFLKHQRYEGRRVLEFGAGQSTYWWAGVAAEVVAIEADRGWFKEVRARAPVNVSIHFVASDDAEAVGKLGLTGTFDVIVIDGLRREHMIEIAIRLLTKDGAIICDNSGGYGFFEGFRGKGFRRVDFYGAAPGVILPSCTSIFFKDGCFLFDNSAPIADVD